MRAACPGLARVEHNNLALGAEVSGLSQKVAVALSPKTGALNANQLPPCRPIVATALVYPLHRPLNRCATIGGAVRRVLVEA